ncbi:GSCOCT00002617001.2-RA-CDS, partial [Cotesia congregata]
VSSLAIDTVKNYNDLESVTYDVGFLFPLMGIMLKTLLINIDQQGILEMIEDVHNPIKKLCYSSELGMLIEIKITIFWQFLDYIIFALVLGSTTVTITIMAMVSETKLPLRGYFPFDATQSPLYEMMYFIQVWDIFINSTWVLFLETSIIELIRWNNVQLIVLQNNYENCTNWRMPRAHFEISDDTYETIIKFQFFKVTEEEQKIHLFMPFDESEVNIQNDSFALRFKTCLKHHRQIVDNVNKFNDYFSVVQFFTVFITCSFACLYLFQIAVNKQSTVVVLNTAILMLAELCHLGFWCVFLNFILDETEKTHQSQYNSGWESEGNIEVQNLLINSLIGSKEPLKITAGKFFVMSLATYLAVIQKSYSYFAILNTVHSG